MPLRSQSVSDATMRVAVIEDDRTMRTLLEKLIAKTPGMESCGSWERGDDAIADICSLRPDVVVIDLELPGVSGEDCIRALAGVLPCAAFVVITVHENPSRVFEALRAGATGYLLKGSKPAEIVAALQAAHRGGSPLSPEIAHLVIRAFQKTPEKKPTMPLPSLAPREREILEKLSRHGAQGSCRGNEYQLRNRPRLPETHLPEASCSQSD